MLDLTQPNTKPQFNNYLTLIVDPSTRHPLQTTSTYFQSCFDVIATLRATPHHFELMIRISVGYVHAEIGRRADGVSVVCQ